MRPSGAAIVLLISDHNDPAIEPITDLLLDRGVDARFLTQADYGDSWTVSVTQTNRTSRCTFEHESGDFTSEQVRSLFIRREFVGPSLGQDVNTEGYKELQTAIHLNSVMRWLTSEKPCINPPLNNLQMMSKVFQRKLAVESGFRVPETFVGSSGAEAFRFQNETLTDLCIKPIEATRVRLDNGRRGAHMTKRFERRTIETLNTLAECPATIQAFVEKNDELRITVVGDQAFACRIDTSMASTDAKTDFRYYDWANTKYEPIELHELFMSQLHSFMRSAGLVYGAFDFVRSKSDEPMFLEVNPMGQWLWIEDLTGLQISAAVADWLADPSYVG